MDKSGDFTPPFGKKIGWMCRSKLWLPSGTKNVVFVKARMSGKSQMPQNRTWHKTQMDSLFTASALHLNTANAVENIKIEISFARRLGFVEYAGKI